MQGLYASGRLFGSVWIELLLGFIIAGLLEVLISPSEITAWLGTESSTRGILVGWLAGLVIPGGPYLLFPIAAKLWTTGAAPGVLIALITAKSLVSPIRMLTYGSSAAGLALDPCPLFAGSLRSSDYGNTGTVGLQSIHEEVIMNTDHRNKGNTMSRVVALVFSSMILFLVENQSSRLPSSRYDQTTPWFCHHGLCGQCSECARYDTWGRTASCSSAAGTKATSTQSSTKTVISALMKCSLLPEA